MKNNNPISADEISDLVRRAKTEDQKAKNLLIDACLPKIRKIARVLAKRYPQNRIEMKDLIDIGKVGAYKSIKRYDENKSPSFIHFAGYEIEESIKSAITSESESVHIPKEKKALSTKIKDTIEQYKEKQHGRQPGFDEIAQSLGVKRETVLEMLESPQSKIEFDEPYSANESVEDTIEDISLLPIDDNILKMERSKIIQDALEILSPREQDILCSLLGYNRTRETAHQISERLKITGERVRRIHDRALTKLRQSNQGKILHTYLGKGDENESGENIFSTDLTSEEIKEKVLKEMEDLSKVILEFQEMIINREKAGKYYVIGSQQFDNALWKTLVISFKTIFYKHFEDADPSLFFLSADYQTAINRLIKLKCFLAPESDDFNEISDVLIDLKNKYRVDISFLQLLFLFYLFVYLYVDISTLLTRETRLIKKDLKKAQRHMSNILADFNEPRSVYVQGLLNKWSKEVDYLENVVHNYETLYSSPPHKSARSINLLIFLVGTYIKQETNQYHWMEVGKLFEHVFHKFDKKDQSVYDSYGLQREYDRTIKTKLREFVLDTLAKIEQLKPPLDKIKEPVFGIFGYLIDHNEDKCK